MKKKNVLLSGVITLLLALCQGVRADATMAINFCDEWETPHLAGETADDFSNWTDSVPIGATGQANGSVILLGSNNFVTCSWTSANTWSGGNENTSEQQLYRVYLDDGNNGPDITIEGLGDWLASEGIGAYYIRIYHSTDNGSGFVPVDIKSDGTVLETVQETNHWTTDGGIRAYVDSGLLFADSIQVEPQTRAGNTRACVSGIKIIGVDEYKAVNPTPEVGVEVPVDIAVSWEQLPGVAGQGVTYNVYFGVDPNEASPTYYGLQSVKTTTSDPADFTFDYDGDLLNSTTYYWTIEAVETNGTVHKGDEWSFITQPASARVEAAPVSLTVAAGSDALFTVDALNAETYQWYKDGELMTDDATDTLYVGQDGPELTILDVQIDDEASYYCRVDNSLNSPADSQPARLMTQRLVGWWELDGDMTDSINDVVAGVPAYDGTSVDPNFVDNGFEGKAYEFYGDIDTLVTMPGSGDYYNFYPQGYTVGLWVNMTETTGSWAAFVNKQTVLEDSSIGFVITSSETGNAVHTLRQSWNDLYSGVNIADGNWHWVVGTYDSTASIGRVYVDGELRAEAQNSTIVDTGTADLMFGAENADNDSPLVGLLDDVKIWSYPLDTIEIASMYVDKFPEVEICVDYPQFDIAGPDGVGVEFRDCKMDLYDLVPVMQTWLECNIVPTCID